LQNLRKARRLGLDCASIRVRPLVGWFHPHTVEGVSHHDV
jgi:hypothetical protein